ncbi:MAG TPA: PsbP-related protein [Candidatus Nitrosocosmicus sp.]|nr:PsbP-related protein [Candidatus Nitrosocosmicus sp.]
MDDNSTRLTSSSKLPLFILIFVLILTALGTGFYLGRRTSNPEPVIHKDYFTPPVVPTAETSNNDPNSSWKTYENKTLGYQVKVPQDWSIEEREGVFIGAQGEAVFLPPSEKNKPAFRTQVAIVKVHDSQEIKTRYDLNTQEQFNQWLKKPATTGEGQRQFKVGEIKIDRIDAIQFISRTLPGDPTEAFYSLNTWFRKDGANYYIEFGGDEKIVAYHTGIYKQMISSFKFTSKPMSPTTSITSKYSCPNKEYVDCMPMMNPVAKPQCEPDYLQWAQKNCPGFQGAAY